MSTLERSAAPRLRYPRNAYAFLFHSLRYTQQKLGKVAPAEIGEDTGNAEGEIPDEAHLTGQELLYGIRDNAREQFGWLAKTVFHAWGIHTTEDFGRMVFELVEKGEMRKTNSDHISDFFDVYDFDEVFNRQYKIDLRHAFR